MCQLKLISRLSDDPNNPGYIDNNQLVTNSHRPSRNFSQKSWPGQFSRSGVTGAWHRVLHVTAWRERDGARTSTRRPKAGPGSLAMLAMLAAQAGLDTDTGAGWVGPHRDEMTIGERDGGDSKDDQETRQSRSVSWRSRSSEWYKETRSENLIFHQWHF